MIRTHKIYDRAALSGFALLTALVVVRNLPFAARAAVGAVLLAGALLCGALSLSRSRTTLRTVCLALLAAGLGVGLLTVHVARQEAMLADVTDRPVAVTGRVSDLPEHDGRFRWPVTLDSVDGKPVTGLKAELVCDADLHGRLGDTFTATVVLTPIREKTDGTFARVRLAGEEKIAFTPGQSGLRGFLLDLRRRLLIRLDGMFDSEIRQVIKGVLLGDTVSMSEETTAAFRACGLSHIVVVSGMHLAVVSGVFLVMAELLTGFRRRVSAAVAMLPTFLFLLLSGGAPSARRATVAVMAYLLGLMLDEDASPLTSLGWAVIVLTLIDPVLPTQIGFLLSCAAVLGITLSAPKAYAWVDRQYWRRVRRPTPKWLLSLSQAACVTIGAQLATAPILLLFVTRLSVVALPANLLTGFAFSAVLLCGVLGVLMLGLRLDPVGYALFALAGLAARGALTVVKGMSRLPFGTVPVWGVWAAGCAFVALAVLAVCVWRRRTRLGALICAALVLLCAMGENAVSHTATRLYVTESGCFIRDPRGGLSLIGFDHAPSGVYDVARVKTATGAAAFGPVVWDDRSEWSRALGADGAKVLLTVKPAEGAAFPYDRQISGSVAVTWHGMTFDRREDCTVVTIGEVTLVVAGRAVSPAALPESDLTVLPQPCLDDAAPRLIRWGLARQSASVYNESGCDYLLTIWPDGRIIIEKG